MKGKRNRRIVVAVDLARPDGRRKLDGLMTFLKSHKVRWDLRIKRGADECRPENIRAFAHWEIDGIVYSLPSDALEKVKALRETLALPIPVVLIDPEPVTDLSKRPGRLAVLRTGSDDVGQTALDCFLSQGVCRSYAYVPDVLNRPWSQRRGKSFQAAIAREGLTCHVFRPRRLGTNDFSELGAWLKSLPKPTGVLAAYDDRALSVIEACDAMGLEIPRDVSILSVGDDAALCENCLPTLSSIRTEQEQAGYAAGKAMLNLLRDSAAEHGEKRRPINSSVVRQQVIFVKKTISHRDSTLAASTAGRLVQKALAYIRTHANRNLKAKDVATALHVSRQLLDLRFRELLSATVTKTITEERLNAVARLLVLTNLSIKEIAEKTGFSDPFHLMHLFRRHYRRTMRQYRQASF